MRLLAPLLALALASPALAQSPELDRLRLQQLQQQNMQAQAQRNAASRANADLGQAIADQQRAQTGANLEATLPTPATTDPAAARIKADDEAMRRLQEAELEASNARIRAITPAR